MQIKVYATLRPIVGDRQVDLPLAEGATVRELVTEMVRRWPELGELMLDDSGQLSRRVHVFIAGRSARHLPEGVETKLCADDEIDIFPAIAGG
jgi:molybdopterin synthase sulfur carrier subunit